MDFHLGKDMSLMSLAQLTYVLFEKLATKVTLSKWKHIPRNLFHDILVFQSKE